MGDKLTKIAREIIGKMIRKYIHEFMTDKKTRNEVYAVMSDLKSLAIIGIKKSVISSMKKK